MYLQISIPDCFFVLFGILVVIGIIVIYSIKITLLNFMFSLIFLIASFPIFLLIILIIRSFAFWLDRVDKIENIYRSVVFSFDNYPMTILNKTLLIVFVTITPVGFFHWLMPIGILLGKFSISFSLWMFALTIAIDIFLFGLFLLIYKKGLARYEGFGG